MGVPFSDSVYVRDKSREEQATPKPGGFSIDLG